jgi:hypothetical protein
MRDTNVHIAPVNRSRAHLRMVVGVSSLDACSTGKERYAFFLVLIMLLHLFVRVGTQVIILSSGMRSLSCR